MFAFIGALGLAASSASAPRHSKPTPLRGSVQGLFSADDYPAEALDRNEQGSVGFLLNIDGTGAVTGCTIRQSSGSELLDTRTCEIIRRRARFQPARDRHGRGVASTFTQNVVWRIEEDLPPSEPWVSRAILVLSADRRPVSCRFEFEGAMATTGSAPGPCSLKGVNPDAPVLKGLATGLTELVDEKRFEIGTGSGMPELAASDVPMGHVLLDLKVDASGKLQSCTVITETGPTNGSDPCLAAAKAYRPHVGPGGKAEAFEATLTLVEFARPGKPASH